MGLLKEALTVIRSFFLFLDFVVYWAIDQLYQLFLKISQSTVIEWDLIKDFGDRVYKLIGIVMLFKIAFSLISYVVNPDDIDKEGKGVSSILKSVIVSLILIVVTPYIFQAAYELQVIILKDNIIGKIVIGDGSGSTSSSELNDKNITYVGKKISFRIFSAFFHPNNNIPSLEDACNDNLIEKETATNFYLNTSCQEAIEDLTDEYVADEYYQAFFQSSVNRLSRTSDFATAIWKTAEKRGELVFIFEYRMVFSTVCGIVVALLLLNFCFDIAIRSVKLGFLQMIAPVPILSYIDPKSGKDGIFKKWVKQCTSTYLSLFVRLLIIYFVIYLISETDGKIYNMVTGETETNLFVSVFIIMGLLLFAKQLPKLLEDLIPGLKLEGGFNLNPMNRLREVPIAGHVAAQIEGGLGGAISGARAGAVGGHPLLGAAFGMLTGARAAGSKVGWGGAKPGTDPHAFSLGMQESYKSMTGNEMKRFNLHSFVGNIPTSDRDENGNRISKADREINTYKDQRKILYNEQAYVNQEYSMLQEQYNQNALKIQNTAQGSTERKRLEEIQRSLTEDISKNRAKASKLDSDISVINDQIKDIKRLYNYDDSNKQALSEVEDRIKGYISEQASRREPTQVESSGNQSRDPIKVKVTKRQG